VGVNTVLHFPFLEEHNVVAGMSECDEGDGATHEGCLSMLSGSTELILINQVHGTTVIEASSENAGTEADGLLLSNGPQVAGIRVADCVPVWIIAPEKRVGALVHAGREGTIHGIAGFAARRLGERYGVTPDRLIALIGPSAGPCCYEVNSKMAEDFEKEGGIRCDRHLNLWDTNKEQLLKSGIPNTSIEISALCTICCGRFHSYRAHKTAARNLCILEIP
jgi:YfiH family protein